METIRDYRLSDFVLLGDLETITQYQAILELLQPVQTVDDPVYCRFGKIEIKPVKSLKWGQVITLRALTSEGTIDAVIQAVSIVTGLPIESIWDFTIIPFYSIINGIVSQLIELGNMEQNELSFEDDDIVLIEAQATERMSRFGILNTIDSLAGGDLLKWKEIQELPYMTVFTKLMMEKTRSEIMKDVRAIQERKNKN